MKIDLKEEAARHFCWAAFLFLGKRSCKSRSRRGEVAGA